MGQTEAADFNNKGAELNYTQEGDNSIISKVRSSSENK